MKKTKIIGWNFLRGIKQTFNADGSTTLEVLASEKSRLEKRLVDVPKQIAQINHSVGVITKDLKWLNSLSNSKRRKWEKQHGKSVEQAQREMSQKLIELKGRVGSLGQEKSRIPSQIATINKQLNALVNGEATGLEQGLNSETAQELGEMALQNERETIDHERSLREAELEQQQLEANQKQGGNQTTVWIVLGIVVLLAIVGFVIYKRKFATKIEAG